MIPKTKLCKRCGTEKPSAEFGAKVRKKYLATYCLPCYRQYHFAWNAKYPYRCRFNAAYARAAERGLDFTLTLDQFTEVAKHPCFYCGGVLGIVRFRGGLDRINHSLGYVPGNIISACAVCNRARNTAFSVEETKLMIDTVLAYRERRRTA